MSKTIRLFVILAIATTLVAANDERPGWLGAAMAQHRVSSDSTRVDWLTVRGIEAGGPAALGGLKMQDVIVAIDGKTIDFANLAESLRTFDSFRAGKPVKFTVARGTARITVTVIPARMTDAQYESWKFNRAQAKHQIEAEAAMKKP
ncbi:MAG TPA: PDZ domain-containing protein [Thermoanaerobaculia bacterium]|nr:PDZ domain-containing protein [Thermoanaerobaculia bacterium]